MAAIRLAYQVEMEDGSTHEVVADQRDLAAWEVQPFHAPIELRPHLATRFLAWHALRRAKVLSVSWEKFNGELCVSVTDAPGGDEEPDPGQTAQSEGP